MDIERVGIIGDPHAESVLLESAIITLQRAGVDTLLCTGDVVTGVGDANRCCHLLESNDVYTVRGNHDRWFFSGGYAETLPDFTPQSALDLRARAWLAALPVTLTFDTPRGALMLAHGTGTSDMLAVYPDDGDWVLQANWRLNALHAERQLRFLVGGHTHQRMLRTFDHLTLLNPGTLRHDKLPGFLLADFGAGTVTTYTIEPETLAVSAGQARALDGAAG